MSKLVKKEVKKKMGEELISIKRLVCSRCDHKWIPNSQVETPAVCPKCHSAYWNRPRKLSKQENDK